MRTPDSRGGEGKSKGRVRHGTARHGMACHSMAGHIKKPLPRIGVFWRRREGGGRKPADFSIQTGPHGPLLNDDDTYIYIEM